MGPNPFLVLVFVWDPKRKQDCGSQSVPRSRSRFRSETKTGLWVPIRSSCSFSFGIRKENRTVGHVACDNPFLVLVLVLDLKRKQDCGSPSVPRSRSRVGSETKTGLWVPIRLLFCFSFYFQNENWTVGPNPFLVLVLVLDLKRKQDCGSKSVHRSVSLFISRTKTGLWSQSVPHSRSRFGSETKTGLWVPIRSPISFSF